MGIGLLGGLLLNLGRGYVTSRIQESQRKKRRTMLDQRISEAQSTLMENPTDPIAQMNFRQSMMNAGIPSTEIGSRLNIAQGVGPYEDRPQMMQAERQMRQEAGKALSPFQQAIQYYNEAAQIKGGDVTRWTGTDDFSAVRKFLKQSLPDESVMGDDINNLKFSQGVPEYIKSWISSLMGEGGLSEAGRRELLATMKNEADTRAARRDEIRQYHAGLAQGAGLDPVNVMMPPQNVMNLPFQPIEQPQPPTTMDRAMRLLEPAEQPAPLPKGTRSIGGGRFVLPDGRIIERAN